MTSVSFAPNTPLEQGQLSPAAQRALGPGPGRAMAARGMLPLPPLDQMIVLYQLSLDPDVSLAQTARATAAGIPEKLLSGTLADASLDPRVLDHFGQLAADKPSVFDVIVLNPSTADPTIAALATKAGAREIDLIAQNEQRLLAYPEIIAAMYMNRRARMSTIDRVVELAVRNNVRVPGLAAWDEVAKALTGETLGSVDDSMFEEVIGSRDDSELTSGDADQPLPEWDEERAEAANSSSMLELQIARQGVPTIRIPLRRTRMTIGSGPTVDVRIANTPANWILVMLEENSADIVTSANERIRIIRNQSVMIEGGRLTLTPIPFRDLPIPAKIRAATLGDAFVRGEAIRDPLKLVSMAAIKSPGVTEIEAARYASNQALAEDVIRYIAHRREWTKMYGVKIALCRNPKTPVSETTRMLPFLREKDLGKLVKSRGVPSAVVSQARKLQMTRGGKK